MRRESRVLVPTGAPSNASWTSEHGAAARPPLNGFYLARAVSALLDAQSSPRRDAFPLTVDWTAEALETVYDVVATTSG